ncbi:MAG TPA: hypothetical protein VK742_08370 [Candidatus Sulfotelmatobacter sp.]|jgi:hypothetical protein|nr:hypothetical protein [Candidatus Sulfotelmatobacter sp.]
MKTLILSLCAAVLCVGCVHAQDSNSPGATANSPGATASSPAVSANAAGASASQPGLTPGEVASADNTLNSVLSFVPPKYKPLVITVFSVLGAFALIGQYVKAFKTGGFFNMLKSVFSHHATAVILLAGLCVCCFTGCKSEQIINAGSGTGAKLTAKIPIPMSGGTESLLDATLSIGVYKDSTIIQPTMTNGVIGAPSVAISQSTIGKANVTATAVSTNDGAALAAGGFDQTLILTGQSGSLQKNNPHEQTITTGK